MPVGRAEQRLPQSFPYRSPSYFEVLYFAVGRCQVGYLDSGFKALPLGTANSVTDLLPQLSCDRAASLLEPVVRLPWSVLRLSKTKPRPFQEARCRAKTTDPVQSLRRDAHRDFTCPLFL